MRLLLDENLSTHIVVHLRAVGHDAVHVSDLGLLGAPDEVVLSTAAQEGRVLISADTDFGGLLALSRARLPSVLLLRRGGRRAEERAQQIVDALPPATEALEAGALVVVEHSRLRIRELPIHHDSD